MIVAELLTRADVLLACRISKAMDRANDERLTGGERAAAASRARRMADRYRYGDRIVYGQVAPFPRRPA